MPHGDRTDMQDSDSSDVYFHGEFEGEMTVPDDVDDAEQYIHDVLDEATTDMPIDFFGLKTRE